MDYAIAATTRPPASIAYSRVSRQLTQENRMIDALEDRLADRELVENRAVWRDAGDWERFATVWHDDGVMMATWFQGPATDFIRATRRAGRAASAFFTSWVAAQSISSETVP